MLAGMALFTIFCIPVAVGKNLQTILIGRFLCGMTGVSPIALFGGGLVDIWHPEQRAIAMATVIGIVLGGPLLAPVMGNFITASHLGWRWTGWLSCIMGGSCTVLVFFGLPETYAPIILQKRQRLDPAFQNAPKETGRWRKFVRVYLVRPFGKFCPVFVFKPCVLLTCLYSTARNRTHPGSHDSLPGVRLRNLIYRLFIISHHLSRTASLETWPILAPISRHDGWSFYRISHDCNTHRHCSTSQPKEDGRR